MAGAGRRADSDAVQLLTTASAATPSCWAVASVLLLLPCGIQLLQSLGRTCSGLSAVEARGRLPQAATRAGSRCLDQLWFLGVVPFAVRTECDHSVNHLCPPAERGQSGVNWVS